MTMARSVAYIGDAGLFLILSIRASADYLLGHETVGAASHWLGDLYQSAAHTLGDHRILIQSVAIVVLITMSLGGHFSMDRDAKRRR